VELPPVVAWLVGEWEGEGRGGYPSLSDFTYREHTSFTQPRADQPVLLYAQHTWLTGPTSRPSHEEVGYLRVLEDGTIDFAVAQPAGRSEVHLGTATEGGIELRTVSVACAPHEALVTEVRRRIERRDADTLWYLLDMAASGHDLGFHCQATLHRVE
jgi:hypothetical protein